MLLGRPTGASLPNTHSARTSSTFTNCAAIRGPRQLSRYSWSNPGGCEVFRTRPDRPSAKLAPGLNWPGCSVDHPPPSSAEVKERVELYLYSLAGSSFPVLGRNSPLRPSVYIYIYIYIYIYMCVCARARACVCVCVCMYVCMYVCISSVCKNKLLLL